MNPNKKKPDSESVGQETSGIFFYSDLAWKRQLDKESFDFDPRLPPDQKERLARLKRNISKFAFYSICDELQHQNVLKTDTCRYAIKAHYNIPCCHMLPSSAVQRSDMNTDIRSKAEKAKLRLPANDSTLKSAQIQKNYKQQASQTNQQQQQHEHLPVSDVKRKAAAASSGISDRQWTLAQVDNAINFLMSREQNEISNCYLGYQDGRYLTTLIRNARDAVKTLLTTQQTAQMEAQLLRSEAYGQSRQRIGSLTPIQHGQAAIDDYPELRNLTIFNERATRQDRANWFDDLATNISLYHAVIAKIGVDNTERIPTLTAAQSRIINTRCRPLVGWTGGDEWKADPELALTALSEFMNDLRSRVQNRPIEAFYMHVQQQRDVSTPFTIQMPQHAFKEINLTEVYLELEATRVGFAIVCLLTQKNKPNWAKRDGRQYGNASTRWYVNHNRRLRDKQIDKFQQYGVLK
ncbi:hypothetical protein BDA99DRAFT_610046 [Phascolomyces articulosus]|uniref:Uncharacterized protein n=1 Tax=Phascolomyces articulosus TaxID=60185 RepID=A0AAD5JMK2_9FUNG|nr:hypothetical protein BDA99DRAFT_610046 [Phascolomyces articulosus]